MPTKTDSALLITDCWATLLELARNPEKVLPDVENVTITGSGDKFQRSMKAQGMDIIENVDIDSEHQTIIFELGKHPLFKKGAIVHSIEQGNYNVSCNYEPATKEQLAAIVAAYTQLIGGIHG